MNIPVQPPAEPQDALYLPTDATPEEIFVAIGELRKVARDEIFRLIEFIDKTDDYVSRELEESVDDVPCDDLELEFNWCGVTADGGKMPLTQYDDELEAGDGGREADDEPSLGSGAPHASSTQALWVVGASDDREDEHDGAEPDVDDEPSLGSSNDSNGHGAVYHHAQPGLITDGEDDAGDNPEHDEAEAGICDQDAELERCGMVL
jgi:hypothetical protein